MLLFLLHSDNSKCLSKDCASFTHTMYACVFLIKSSDLYIVQFFNFCQILDLLGECVISLVLSNHNKNLKWWTSVSAPCCNSVFFKKVKKNTSLRHEGMLIQKTQRETRSPPNFGSFFYMFFPPPPGLPYINWASQECRLFYLRSFWPSDLPLFYFHGLFPSF